MFSLPLEDLENIAERTEAIWPRNKNFLITGGTGFFGRWLVESCALLEEKKLAKNKFIIISRQSKSELQSKIPVFKNKCFEFLQQDLQYSFGIDSEVDFVLHAASDVSKIKNSKAEDFSSVLTATKNVISAVKDKNISKLLYVSSGGVYDSAQGATKESDLQLSPTDHIQSYSEAKRQSEIAVRQMALFSTCSSRCFSFVGPFVDSKMAVMDMLEKKLRREKITVNSPSVVRSFMYPTDLVVSLFRLLLLSTKHQEYNVGSNQPVSLLKLAEKISRIKSESELELELEIKNSAPTSSLAGQIYYPSIDRINQEFGPHMTVDLDSALLKTFNFLLKQENHI